jgi:HD-GYP domain-containing protein (c-di-GMP phosphodiesterase class II)
LLKIHFEASFGEKPMSDDINKLLKKLRRLNQIGIALSGDKKTNEVLDEIILGAQELTGADGGTIYLLKDDKALHFSLVHNSSLNIHIENNEQLNEKFKPIYLLHSNGDPNLSNVVSAAVNQNQTINIDDAYHQSNYDFSGTKKFDGKLNYRSQSFLTVPMRNHLGKIIGVMQLINATSPKTGKIVPFSETDQELAESLASQGAITLTKQELLDAQKKLFEAFIALIAKAIDEKSIYTSNHCTRVPLIAMMLAETAQNETQGPFGKFHLDDEAMEELRIAAWLHDCGKVSTPEYVMDKATKLEHIMDGIALVDLRFEILRRDRYIEQCHQRLKQSPIDIPDQHELNDDHAFLQQTNTPGEFLTKELQQRIKDIQAKYTWKDFKGNTHSVLDDLDVENLSIARGSLNDTERQAIQNHASVTYRMLRELPYPEHLKNIPDIASSHHETLDGKGYPRGLHDAELSIQARIIAIADIFEALTASDRPYKKAKTLSETLGIMNNMQKNRHIDPDLYQLFVEHKLYLKYAKEYLKPEQVDID